MPHNTLRIRKRRDFLKVSCSGLCYRGKFLVVQSGKNGLDYFRSGFTATKRLGNAVVRNRCKRRMRAAAGIWLPTVGLAGIDYVFIARRAVQVAEWGCLSAELRKAVCWLNNRLQS